MTVQVKPLVWSATYVDGSYRSSKAISIIGEYEAWETDIAARWQFAREAHAALSMDEAKAAAQADYERRIMSALVQS